MAREIAEPDVYRCILRPESFTRDLSCLDFTALGLQVGVAVPDTGAILTAFGSPRQTFNPQNSVATKNNTLRIDPPGMLHPGKKSG